MGQVKNGRFLSSYIGQQIDALLAAMAQANPLPSGMDWVAFIDDCVAAQGSAENAQAAAEAAATAAETWASNPPYIGNNGNWYIYDTQTEQFVDSGLPSRGATGQDGPAGADGADGVSPDVTITTITGGHRVTITDADHPSGQSFDVPDGEDGTDGVSPDVTITTITGGHRVTITDADHPSGQNFDVMDGSGAGDMLASTYDPQGAVANAGGIPDYVAGQMPSVPSASSTTPSMDGTGAAGTAQTFARGDHVHPTDTSLQPKTLAAAITVGGVSQTTVEGALGAVNTLADGKMDGAANAGTAGQVLTKTANGAEWQNATGGVTSFNSRTGAVTPQSGDYTAALVGAVPIGFGNNGEIPPALSTQWADDGELKSALSSILDDMSDKESRRYWINYCVNTQLGITNGILMDIFKLWGSGSTGAAIAWFRQYNGLQCIRRFISGTWFDVEWINPLLLNGVEYRTAERFNQKPVYVKAVTIGTIADGTVTAKQISNSHNITNLDYLIGISGTAKFSNATVWATVALPYVYGSGDSIQLDIKVSADAEKVRMFYSNSGGVVPSGRSITATAILKYTKITD